MDSITLKQIDSIRREGLRPQVVGCILHDNKILFVYKEKYKLWQLPQGGIDNKESIKQAVIREMTEELGVEFTKSFQIGEVIGDDTLIFPKHLQGSRNLQTDTGEEKLMLGKKYFFIPIQTDNKNLDISQTEFDDYKWLNYEEALQTTSTIYQKGKQQLTQKIITLLHKNKLL
jgi:putative (di)nucleoside polyphosphate hydrolase